MKNLILRMRTNRARPSLHLESKFFILSSALIALALIFVTSPISAHHAYATEYDTHVAVSLTGKITRVEWMNPHIYLYVDSKDESGKPVHYAIQAGAPTTLYRLGWKSDSLKPGDIVTVIGYKARDGWNKMNAIDVIFPDGRKIFAGVVDSQHN